MLLPLSNIHYSVKLEGTLPRFESVFVRTIFKANSVLHFINSTFFILLTSPNENAVHWNIRPKQTQLTGSSNICSTNVTYWLPQRSLCLLIAAFPPQSKNWSTVFVRGGYSKMFSHGECLFHTLIKQISLSWWMKY